MHDDGDVLIQGLSCCIGLGSTIWFWIDHLSDYMLRLDCPLQFTEQLFFVSWSSGRCQWSLPLRCLELSIKVAALTPESGLAYPGISRAQVNYPSFQTYVGINVNVCKRIKCL